MFQLFPLNKERSLVVVICGLALTYAIGASASEEYVDLSTPPQETVVGHFEGSFLPSQIQVNIRWNNPDECTEESGRNCNPNINTPRCQFSLDSLPLRDESGNLNGDLPFHLFQEQRIQLNDVFTNQQSDCDLIVARWKAQLPQVIHYEATLMERTWIDWDTYANPAICRNNHTFFRKIEIEKMSSGETSSVRNTEEILNRSVCDKIFKLSH